MTMENEVRYKEAKKRLDRNATYFWQNRNGRYALVNAFTLKTLCGVAHRLDAIALTNSLIQDGYSVARLAEMEG